MHGLGNLFELWLMGVRHVERLSETGFLNVCWAR